MGSGGRPLLGLLLCCTTTILATTDLLSTRSNALGDHSLFRTRSNALGDLSSTRSNALGDHSVKISGGGEFHRAGRRGVAPGEEDLLHQPLHHPGRPWPWATHTHQVARHRLHPPLMEEHSHLLTTSDPSLASPTLNHLLDHETKRSQDHRLDHKTTLWVPSSPYHQASTLPQAALSRPLPSSREPSLRRRRSSPPAASLSSHIGSQVSPSTSSIPPHFSVSQPSSSNSHFNSASLTSSSSPSQTLFIPVLVPNIPELTPYLQASGLYIPTDTSVHSVSAQQTATDQQTHTRPSVDRHLLHHVVDRPAVQRQSTRLSTASHTTPAVSSPIHITINIVPEALAQDSFRRTASPAVAPSGGPATPDSGFPRPDVSQAHHTSSRGGQIRFPVVPGRPTPSPETSHPSPLPYRIAFLPTRYPTQETSHLFRQPSQEVPLSSHELTHLLSSPTTTSPGDSQSSHSVESLPLSSSTTPVPLPQFRTPAITTQPANDSRSSQAILFSTTTSSPSPTTHFPSPVEQESKGTLQVTSRPTLDLIPGFIDTRIAIRAPLKLCTGECEVRDPTTEKCVTDISCKRDIFEFL